MAGKLEKFNFLKNKNSESIVNSELTNQLDSFATAQNDYSGYSERQKSIILTISPRPLWERDRVRGKKATFTLAEGATHVAHWNNSRKIAFTLAEVLITLGIIGVVAAMTLPSLIQNYREKEMVAGLEKFVSTISQAVALYKADNDCTDNISTCISYNSKGDENCQNFIPIAEKMNVMKSVTVANSNTADWLPDKAFNYLGEEQEGIYGGVSKKNIGTCAFLLNDGTTFAVDVNPTNFDIMVDVNGKKLPNRVGQDIFPLLVGSNANFNYSNKHNYDNPNDIIFYPLGSNYNAFDGLCMLARGSQCNPLNTNPNKDSGASPTAYVLMTKKLPPKY